MKEIIKKIIPSFALSFYHKSLAYLGDLYYGHPSRKLKVIGVTGTKGKTTACNILWHLLEQAGYKAGLTTTSNFKIHQKEWVNTQKMTMVGRWQLHKLLRQMVDAGCQYAVVETSSEGIKQWRHYKIDYNLVFFLNLTPEHLEAHGGFKNYKTAKQVLFQNNPEAMFVNLDDEHALDFLKFSAQKKITYGTKGEADLLAENIKQTSQGITWSIKETNFSLKQLGKFNIYNVLPAVALGTYLGFDLNKISSFLKSFSGMPGRLQKIEQGQDFHVLVDYCYEPKSLESALITIKDVFATPDTNIICVFGSTGGGRDIWRRPVMAEISSKYCKYSIVTNDEPYEDDPNKIAEEIIAGFKKQGKQENKDYFKILDRRQAIKKAFILAKKRDVVLLAGMGSSIVRAVKGGSEKWDDREVARDLLKSL